MKTFKLNADGGHFTGDHTLVMTRINGVPTPIGIIEDLRYRPSEEVDYVKAYFVGDNFAANDETFLSKAAAEREIIARFEA